MLKLKLGLNPKSEIKSKLPKVNLILNLKSISGNTWADRVGGNDATVFFPCLDLAIGEVITFADLTGVDLTSYEGTATIAKSGDTLLCSGAGTCYNVSFNNGDSLPLSGHLFSKYSEINAISTTGTFTDQFQSTFNPLEKYNLGIKSSADANSITRSYTEDGVTYEYYKYDASAETLLDKVTGVTSSGVVISLDSDDVILGLKINDVLIDMNVDRNWTGTNISNIIAPQYIQKVATFPVTFPMTFVETESGLDVYGSPIVTYQRTTNALPPYSKVSLPELTPDLLDRTDTDYWDLFISAYNQDPTDERAFLAKDLMRGTEFLNSIMESLYIFTKQNSVDDSLSQLVVYSSTRADEMNFDGVNDYVNLGRGFDLTPRVDEFKITASFKTTEERGTIFSYGADSLGANRQVHLYVTSGYLRFYLGGTGTSLHSPLVNDGEWHTVELYAPASTTGATLTLDGIVGITSGAIGSTTGSQNGAIGIADNGTYLPFKGSVNYVEVETQNKTYRWEGSNSVGTILKDVYPAVDGYPQINGTATNVDQQSFFTKDVSKVSKILNSLRDRETDANEYQLHLNANTSAQENASGTPAEIGEGIAKIYSIGSDIEPAQATAGNQPKLYRDSSGFYLLFDSDDKLAWSGISEQTVLLNGTSEIELTTANEIVYADLATVDYKLRTLTIE